MAKREGKGRRNYATALVDHGTKERKKHGGVDYIETISAGVLVAKAREECVLDRYWQRMQIIDRLHIAGCRLRGFWMSAAYPAATTSSYGDQRGSRHGDGASLARIALRRVLLDCGLAHQSLEQPVLVISSTREQRYPVVLPIALTEVGHVTISVCGLDEWAGGTKRLDQLREGLRMLADHWKIEHD